MKRSLLKSINILASFSGLLVFSPNAKANTTQAADSCVTVDTEELKLDELVRCIRESVPGSAVLLRRVELNTGVSLEDLIDEGVINLEELDRDSRTSPITLTLTDRTSPITITVTNSQARSIDVDLVLEDEIAGLLVERGIIKEEELIDSTVLMELIRANISSLQLSEDEVLFLNR